MELRAIYPYTRSKVSNIIARQGCSNTFDSSAFFLLRSSNNKAKATVPMNRLYSSKREFCLAASARTGDIFGNTFGNKTNIPKASFANISKYPSGRIETKKGFYINQLCKYATATLKKDTPSAGSGGSSGHSGTSSGGLKLKCSEFDKDGNLTVRNLEFSRSDFCTKHGLLARDLRKIDSKSSNILPSILVRNQTILINFLSLRGIIEHDRMIIFESSKMPSGLSPISSSPAHISPAYANSNTTHFNPQQQQQQQQQQSSQPHVSLFGGSEIYQYCNREFITELQALLSSKKNTQDLPFEFRALESVLILVLKNLSAEEEILVNLVQSLLLYLEESIDRTKLKELLQYSKRLSKFEQKVENIRKALDEVLEQDEDLAAMYLTNVYNYGQPQDVDSHQEIEYLLETYLMQVEEISANIDSVLSQLKTTEEIANIILDSQRNSLLLLEIRLTILAVGVGLGTFVSSLFGMNLLSGYEEHSTAFILVCTVAFVLSFFTVGYAFLRMNKMLRKMF